MSGACLVLGAGGRVGRLLRGAEARWGRGRLVFQSRTPGPGIDIAAPYDAGLARALGRAVAAVLILPGVTYARDPGALEQNADLAVAGLGIAAAIGAPLAVLASSAAVYAAEPGHGPYGEAHADLPAGAYGRSKRAMEAAAIRWAETMARPPRLLILRLANIAGADMLADAVRRARPQAPLLLDRFADGQGPRRSYLSPRTLAAALAAFADRPPAAPVTIANLAEPGSVAMADLLAALAAAGHPVPWAWQAAPPAALPSLALQTAAIRRLVGDALPDRGTPARLVGDWLDAAGGVP